MTKIIFSDNFFKSQSEAAALSSILNSYRRFSGLFFCEFILEISDNTVNFDDGKICLSTDKKRQILEAVPLGSERESMIKAADYILRELSALCEPLKSSINLFLEHKLWELEILFLFCEESEKIRNSLLNKYTEDLIEDNIQKTGRGDKYVDFMRYYYKYLIRKLQLDNQKQLPPGIIDREYRTIAMNHYMLWQKTNNIMYLRLACTVLENTSDADFTNCRYDEYIWYLKHKKHVEYEISNAYFDLARYLEKTDEMRKSYEYKYVIKDYYKKALKYDNNNFRAMYKIALSADNFYGFRDGMFVHLRKLRKYLKNREKTINSNIRVFLYDYKTTYHLGVIELKVNNNSNRALELFKEAERLFDITIMNIWKRLGLYHWSGSGRELLNFIHAEMLYNYMANVYLQNEGVNSPEYIETQNKKMYLMRQFD